MEKSKKVIFISHCLLNQNAKSKGGAKSPGAIKEIVDILAESGIGIVQLPCPQVEYDGGLDRKAKDKVQYDNKKFRADCKKMAGSMLGQIENYLSKNYTVVGILGVEFSPTCAVHQLQNGTRAVPGKGILMEELDAEMRKKRFQVPVIGVNLNNIFSSVEKVQSLISCS